MRRRVLMGAAVLALGGCVDLAPADRKPALPIPATLPSGGAFPGAAAEASRDNAPWRDVFLDPRLRTVIDQALANNRDLRVAAANVAAARSQYVVQRSDQLPNIDGSASATYGRSPLSAARGISLSATGHYNTHQYTLTGGFTAFQLDLFGKLRDLSRAALDTYFATREARDAVRVSLIGSVADAWLTLGADRDQLAIATATLASGQASLSLTLARFDAGSASELDVDQARTVVEQARFDRSRLTAQVAKDKDALDLLVGAPVAETQLPAALTEEGVVLTRLPAGLASDLLRARPDVAQAEDRLKAANANIGAARAAFFPDISLTASGGLTSAALSSLFKGASQTWSFAPTLTQPIFDAGRNLGNLSYAKAQRDAALATYDKTVQTAFREVADALADRGSIDEEVAAQVALVDAADRSYRLSDARYRSGADSYINSLIAQRTLYAARQSLTTARLSRSTNLVTLYTSLGGGLR